MCMSRIARRLSALSVLATLGLALLGAAPAHATLAFQPAVQGGNGNRVAIGDVNGDGRRDYVVSNGSGGITPYIQSATTDTFTSGGQINLLSGFYGFPAGTALRYITMGDVDRDGFDD